MRKNTQKYGHVNQNSLCIYTSKLNSILFVNSNLCEKQIPMEVTGFRLVKFCQKTVYVTPHMWLEVDFSFNLG